MVGKKQAQGLFSFILLDFSDTDFCSHNPKVVGSNPASATTKVLTIPVVKAFFFCIKPTTEGFTIGSCNRRQWRMKGRRGWRSGRKNQVSEQHEDFDRPPQEDARSNPASLATRTPNHPSGQGISFLSAPLTLF